MLNEITAISFLLSLYRSASFLAPPSFLWVGTAADDEICL